MIILCLIFVIPFSVLNSKLPKILWTNPNPGVSFAAQDVVLNSTDYDYLEIVYNETRDISSNIISSPSVQKGERCQVIYIGTDDSNRLLRRFRVASVSSDGDIVTFNVARYQGSYHSAFSDGAQFFVPKRIVGYKYGN